MNIKSYTSIEQSRVLVEILPIESADMYYSSDGTATKIPYTNHYLMWKDRVDEIIPCWSLAALLSVLPKGTNISTPKPINELGYCCWNQYDEIYANNPVDACVEMIEKLNKLNLL